MKSNKYKYYLADLVDLIKEKATEAKSRSRNDSFESGRSMAFYETLSLIKDQASAFDIDMESTGLQELNPEEYLNISKDV